MIERSRPPRSLSHKVIEFVDANADFWHLRVGVDALTTVQSAEGTFIILMLKSQTTQLSGQERSSVERACLTRCEVRILRGTQSAVTAFRMFAVDDYNYTTLSI